MNTGANTKKTRRRTRLERVVDRLRAVHPLETDDETVRAAGTFFRKHWNEWLHENFGPACGYREIPAGLLPGRDDVAPGSCIFGAATACAIFGGTVDGNRHHVWNDVGGRRIDLSGLGDIACDEASELHAAYLRSRDWIVVRDEDRRFAMQIEAGTTIDSYTTCELFASSHASMNSKGFPDRLESVLDDSLEWADAVIRSITTTQDTNAA